jgi:hypothetical protein
MKIDPSGLSLVCDDRRFLVQQDNAIAMLYAYRGYANKPYIATLMGPSGRNVLEDSPGDHTHHHGVWWGHGDVNGVDFYLEVPAPGRRLGRIEHTEFSRVTDENPHFGFTETLTWRDDNEAEVIAETRSVDLRFRDESHYTVDLESTYQARADLAFGTTKESVLPGIRMAEALTGACGGHIRSSHGGKGERGTMSVGAQWIDYYGDRRENYGQGDVVEGIAIFDHPQNPNHPNPFFVRAYGPVSPFQGHYFTGEASLAEGDSLTYRHRLVVHYGDTEQAKIAERYTEWTK